MFKHNITTAAAYPTQPDPTVLTICAAAELAADPAATLQLSATPEGPQGYVTVAPNAAALMAAVARQPVVVYIAIDSQQAGDSDAAAAAANAAFWMFYEDG